MDANHLCTVIFILTQLCSIYCASFSFSGTTDPSSTTTYWSSPSIARFQNQDSISFSCASPSTSNYVTYSVFNITVSGSFIHLEGFFDDSFSSGASIFIFDSRNYAGYFNPSYGTSCLGFKAGFTPYMVESSGSPYIDEYIYLSAGTYYVVITSYYSNRSGYFVVNVESTSWLGSISNSSPLWQVPNPGSTQSNCGVSSVTVPFGSWYISNTGGYYDIAVTSNSTNIVPSLNVYLGNFQTSQSTSIFNPCYQTSSMHLISSSQQAPYASTSAPYVTVLYGVYLSVAQAYSLVVSSNSNQTSSLTFGIFMRPSHLVTLSEQSPSWSGPEFTAYSSKLVCQIPDASRRYQIVNFKAQNSIYCIDTGRGGGFDSAVVLYRGNWTTAQGVCPSSFLMAADTGDGIPFFVHLTPGQWYTAVVTHYSTRYSSGSDIFFLATGQQITSDSISTESMSTTSWEEPSETPLPSAVSPGGESHHNNLKLLWILPVSLFMVAIAGIISLALFLRKRNAALHNVQGTAAPVTSSYRNLEEEEETSIRMDSVGNPLPPLLFESKPTALSPAIDPKETYHPPAIEPSTSTSFDTSEPFV